MGGVLGGGLPEERQGRLARDDDGGVELRDGLARTQDTDDREMLPVDAESGGHAQVVDAELLGRTLTQDRGAGAGGHEVVGEPGAVRAHRGGEVVHTGVGGVDGEGVGEVLCRCARAYVEVEGVGVELPVQRRRLDAVERGDSSGGVIGEAHGVGVGHLLGVHPDAHEGGLQEGEADVDLTRCRLRNAHEGDEAGDADEGGGQGEQGASGHAGDRCDGLAHDLSQGDAPRYGAASHAAFSVRPPSLTRSTRRARDACSSLWVTMMMVVPDSLREEKTSRTP